MPQECKASSPVLCSPRNETRYVGKYYLSLPVFQDAQLRLEGCEWVVGDLSKAQKRHNHKGVTESPAALS